MQIDMHFYGTYALARAAGLPPDIARTVATSAQFVDDATDKHPYALSGASFIVPAVSCHALLDKENADPADQWQVWIPYHFLPGNQGTNAEERLLCRPGLPGNPSTDLLEQLVREQLEQNLPHAWHLLGVATHVLQDTFSHWGFSGLSSDYNRVEQGDIVLDLAKDTLKDEIMQAADEFWEGLAGSVAEDCSRLGHGAVATYPDRPYLRWEFEYEVALSRCPRQENALHAVRDNQDWFLQGCERVYGLFAEAARTRLGASPQDFSLIRPLVHAVIAVEARKEGRIQAWKDAMLGGGLFPRRPEDGDLAYDGHCWSTAGLHRQPLAVKLDAQRFHKASRTWRCFVLTRILPGLDLV